MAVSKKLLLRAARTAIREDRLTELFSVVLAGHPALAQSLLQGAQPPLPVGREVEVSTQVRTRRGKRVDMELVATERHSIVSRLWSEHKTGSGYSPDQLPGYASDLAALGGCHRLITIVDHLDEAPNDARWDRFTWQDVAARAWRVGRDDPEGGPQWRTAACTPNAPARQRLLHELVSYLEEEHHVVLDPISHLDVVAFARANRISEALTALLERTAEVSRLDPDGGCGSEKNDFGAYWQVFKDAAGWAQPLEGYAELHVADEDHWASDRVGEPGFGAGFTLPDRYYDGLRANARREWLTALEQEGFSIAASYGFTRIYRTLYLAELISKGATIDTQARALAAWTEESIRSLQAHDPKVEPIAQPVSRRAQRASDRTQPDAPPRRGS